jgi:hypothetical protein
MALTLSVLGQVVGIGHERSQTWRPPGADIFGVFQQIGRGWIVNADAKTDAVVSRAVLALVVSSALVAMLCEPCRGEDKRPNVVLIISDDDPTMNCLSRTCLRNEWKLILRRDGSAELYDVVADTLEENDLAATRPDLVAQMTRLINQWWNVEKTTP